MFTGFTLFFSIYDYNYQVASMQKQVVQIETDSFSELH